MALRGSLLEFELPNIFQLIGNDGKTGQLVLYRKEDEAFVIFSHGTIIAAGNSSMNLQTVIFKYLMSVKHYSEEELNELLYLCQGEMRVFTQELVAKRYLSKEELSSMARVTVEDLACGLFLWELGHYRFDSLESVEDYRVGALCLSCDAVTMEAMRRVDEWKRMRKSVPPSSVFIRVKAIGPAAEGSVLNFDSAEHVLDMVDGVSTVETIVKNAFFTEYRVYETLMGFWQNNRIMPAQEQRPRGKTPQQDMREKRSLLPSAGLISWALVHISALLIFLIGFGFNGAFLGQKHAAQRWECNERSVSQSETALRIATLFYHETYGVLPTRALQLKESGLITAYEASQYAIRK
jgi:hypothetical protein